MLDRTPPSKRRRFAIGLAAVAGVVALAMAAVALWPTATAPPSPGPSPAGSGTAAPSPSPDAGSSPAASASPAAAPADVYGYLPYWEMDAGASAYLATTAVTTVALFSVGPTPNLKALSRDVGYRAIVSDVGKGIIAAAKARGTRVELVFTSFSAARNRALFATAPSGAPAKPDASRLAIATALVALATSIGADGVNLDVENFNPVDLPGFTSFVAAVRAQLDAARPGMSLSVATTAGPIGAGMAEAALAAGADRDFLMGYDFHYPGSEPGASSPLDFGDRPERTLRSSLARYQAFGIPLDRVIIGLPLYGNSWPIDPASRKVLVRSGAGVAWLPANHVGDRALIESEQVFDPAASVEIFEEILPNGTRRRLYYDSPRSLEPKVEWALASGCAGVGFWALGYDKGWPGYWDMIRRLIPPRA